MKIKNNIKSTKVRNRKMELVDKGEIKNWNNLFSLFGYKKDCYRKTGVAPATIKRVLDKKKGVEDVISSLRKYYNENSF
jgi:hypothetical protein